MKNPLIILIALFSLSLSVRAQEKIKAIKNFVKKKDTSLYSLDRIVSGERDPFFDQFIRRIDFNHRQLVGSFTDNRGNYNLLAQRDSIGVYLVVVTKLTNNQKGGYIAEPFFFWKDDSRLDTFLSRFNSLYDSEITAKSLSTFTLHRYGRACSVDGAPTERYDQMQKLVTQVDYQTLRQWMKEFDYETKLLGAVGLLRLEKSGIKVSQKDNAVISNLINSNILINFCAGCTFWEPVTPKFIVEFDPI